MADSRVDHRDFTQGTAVWVRFCAPLAANRAAALTSDWTLQDPEATVRGWQARAVRGITDCADTVDSTAYSIQVGFEDGTVAAIDGLSPVGCPATVRGSAMFLRGDPYRDLMTELASTVRGPATPARADLACPNTTETPISSGDYEVLSSYRVSSALVCDYDPTSGDPVGRRTVMEAEDLRLATLSNRRFTSEEVLGCRVDLYAYDKVVIFRSRAEDIAVHFTSQGCNYSMTIGDPGHNDVKVGNAGQVLVGMLNASGG